MKRQPALILLGLPNCGLSVRRGTKRVNALSTQQAELRRNHLYWQRCTPDPWADQRAYPWRERL